MAFVVPPGGFAGFNQMTPASRRALSGASSITRSFGKRSRKRKAKASGTKRRAGGKKRKSKMKFGSPAWQKKYKVGAYKK